MEPNRDRRGIQLLHKTDATALRALKPCRCAVVLPTSCLTVPRRRDSPIDATVRNTHTLGLGSTATRTCEPPTVCSLFLICNEFAVKELSISSCKNLVRGCMSSRRGTPNRDFSGTFHPANLRHLSSFHRRLRACYGTRLPLAHSGNVFNVSAEVLRGASFHLTVVERREGLLRCLETSLPSSVRYQPAVLGDRTRSPQPITLRRECCPLLSERPKSSRESVTVTTLSLRNCGPRSPASGMMDPAENPEKPHHGLHLNDFMTSSSFKSIARKICEFGRTSRVLDRACSDFLFSILGPVQVSPTHSTIIMTDLLYPAVTSILTCISVITFIAAICVWLLYVDFAAIPGIPEIPGGSLLHGHLYMLGQDHATTAQTWSQQHGWPIYQVRLGNRRVIFLNGFEVAKEWLVTRQNYTIDRPRLYTFHNLVSKTSGRSGWVLLHETKC